MSGTRVFSFGFGILLLVLAGVWVPTPALFASDSLVWLHRENRVDADIESTDLRTVLGRIAAETGWEIYVEPDAKRSVSVRFKNLAPGDALRRLLNDLNFALLPQANAPSKLYIYRTSLQEATQLIPAAPATKTALKRSAVIPNELVVTLKSDSREKIEELARRLGAKIIGSIEDLNVYRLQFADAASANAARQLLADETSLNGVESNYEINRPSRSERLQLSSPAPLSLQPDVNSDGSKVIVGLIDMAVQPLGNGMDEFLLPAIQIAGEPRHTRDELSHGTSMAETILQGVSLATPEGGGASVRILPVDVYGPREETTTFDVARGIHAAVNAGATVINLSMAGAGDSRLMYNLIQQSYKSGVLFFGAAGNEPSTAPSFPAAYPEVIAVTAGDRRGNIAPYANRGSFVDVVAPGASVIHYDDAAYLVNGTSTSTAYMSGSAAAIRAQGKPPADVESILRGSFGVKRTTR